jgi:hypothetical protein
MGSLAILDQSRNWLESCEYAIRREGGVFEVERGQGSTRSAPKTPRRG